MDLYEALKAGTSADELEDKFQEELRAALKRYNAEEDLNDTREELAAEIIDYLALVLGEGFVKDFSVKDIVEMLKSMEKDLKTGYNVIKKLDKNMKASGSLSIDKSDEDIINAFLKGLK